MKLLAAALLATLTAAGLGQKPDREGPLVVELGDLAQMPPGPDGCPFGFSSTTHKGACRFAIEFAGQYAMRGLRCELVRPFGGKDKDFFALHCEYAKPAAPSAVKNPSKKKNAPK